MTTTITRESESIDWTIMGPIYKDQYEALQKLVKELRELITKLSKENNQ